MVLLKTYNKEEYKNIVKKASPNSPLLKNCFFAFIFGGAICTLGQLFLELFLILNITEDLSKTLVSVSLIFCSAVITSLGYYDNIAKVAGAGTLVPITGFANSMVAPAMEFKSEGMITGLGVKLFVIAGPVLIFSVSASVLYGVIYFFVNLFIG